MIRQAPTKLQKLQQALHAEAKESPDFRFYALYVEMTIMFEPTRLSGEYLVDA